MSLTRALLLGLLFSAHGNCDKWVGPLLNEVLGGINFESSNVRCSEELDVFKENLQNSSIWAVKMAESSASSTTGILSGNVYHLGNFDQCISVFVPKISLKGKYCLVRFKYWPNSTKFPDFYRNTTVNNEPSNFDSVWSALQVTQDLRFLQRDTLYLGLCIPASCPAQMIMDSFKNQATMKFSAENIETEWETSEKFCSVKERHPDKSLGFYAFIGLFASLFLLVTIGTTIQICNESKGDYKAGDLDQVVSANKIDQQLASFYSITDTVHYFYSFSIIYNTQRLLKESTSELRPASGLKVLSMFIIIFGHRFLLTLYAPVVNMNENELKFGKFWETYILNGNIVVNTFFCTTGYITFYKILSAIENKTKYFYLSSFIYRFCRVSVVYGLTIWFMMNIKYIGDGPLWHKAAEERAEVCQEYWWIHLLYVNNYVFANKLCLLPSWYFSCDMQLFVLSLFIGFIHEKNSKLGKVLLVFLLFISVLLIPGLVTYFGKYSGTAIFYIRNISKFHFDADYINTYITTHFRLSPYVIGMSAAVLHIYLKKWTIKMPFWIHVVLAFSTIFLTGISLLGAWQFYLPNKNYTALHSSLYAIYSKLLWSVNMCWLIMTNVAGGEEILTTRILSSKIFMILNKLNLLVLLIHTPLQFILIMSSRTQLYVTHFTTVWMAMGDIMLSYFLAFILYLLVEAPMASIMNNVILRQT